MIPPNSSSSSASTPTLRFCIAKLWNVFCNLQLEKVVVSSIILVFNKQTGIYTTDSSNVIDFDYSQIQVANLDLFENKDYNGNEEYIRFKETGWIDINWMKFQLCSSRIELNVVLNEFGILENLEGNAHYIQQVHFFKQIYFLLITTSSTNQKNHGKLRNSKNTSKEIVPQRMIYQLQPFPL
ncbi:hypothetical protein ACTA71_001692 [Dictyostelium dimigraforme]